MNPVSATRSTMELAALGGGGVCASNAVAEQMRAVEAEARSAV